VRGAISIGRRLLDPLAELVKIDPKSIGVGQYQHDVDQTLLKKKLSEVVESCVNFIGVDLNLASVELLSYVAGLKRDIAVNIIAYRNEHGAFTDRTQLLDVPKLGKKAFENAAGFLRIKNSANPLDDSAVHPESYAIVERMAAKVNLPVKQLIANNDAIAQLNPQDFITDTAGSATIKDIIDELRKPGRDPRSEFVAAKFRDDVTKIADLTKGMILEGVVTNVANFGAFVDIGVHQDGLVHISKMGIQYVTDPNAVVKVGQVLKVKVVDVDEALNRISLSMNLEEERPVPERRVEQRQTGQTPRYTGPQKGREGDRRPHQQQGQQQRSDRKPMPQKPQKFQKPQEPKKNYTLQDLIKKFNA